MSQFKWVPHHCSDVTLIPDEETQLWRQIPGFPRQREDISSIYIYNVLATAHDKDARGKGNLFVRIWREPKDDFISKKSLDLENKIAGSFAFQKIEIKDSASFDVVMVRGFTGGFTADRKNYVYLVRRDYQSPSKKHTLEYALATDLVASPAEVVKPTKVAALPKEFTAANSPFRVAVSDACVYLYANKQVFYAAHDDVLRSNPILTSAPGPKPDLQ
jgi:hypothetical protein